MLNAQNGIVVSNSVDHRSLQIKFADIKVDVTFVRMIPGEQNNFQAELEAIISYLVRMHCGREFDTNGEQGLQRKE